MWLFVFGMILNGGLVPWYLTISRYGLIDSFWALILPGAVPVWSVIILMNFFRNIPKELDEAARGELSLADLHSTTGDRRPAGITRRSGADACPALEQYAQRRQALRRHDPNPFDLPAVAALLCARDHARRREGVDARERVVGHPTEPRT